jgi:hypothetical protein
MSNDELFQLITGLALEKGPLMALATRSRRAWTPVRFLVAGR